MSGYAAGAPFGAVIAVQIVLKPEAPGAPLEVLLSLCDDGSTWSLPRPLGPPRPDQKWQRLPTFPASSLVH